MIPHCDLCAAHLRVEAGPYYRQIGEWMKNLCGFHERARRRLVLFRQREARAVERSAWLCKDEDGATVHGVN